MAAAYLRDHRRRLLIAWGAALVGLVLNPWVAPYWIEFVTSPNAYWRLFYLFPFSLILGLGGLLVMDGIREQTDLEAVTAIALVTALLVAPHFSPATTSALDDVLEFPPKSYDLPHEALRESRSIVRRAPQGPMLAPPEISGIIPLLTSAHPQARVREDGVRLWFGARGKEKIAAERVSASNLAGNACQTENCLDAFVKVLDRMRPRTVAVRRGPQTDTLRHVLRRKGYSSAPAGRSIYLFIRDSRDPS